MAISFNKIFIATALLAAVANALPAQEEPEKEKTKMPTWAKKACKDLACNEDTEYCKLNRKQKVIITFCHHF